MTEEADLLTMRLELSRERLQTIPEETRIPEPFRDFLRLRLFDNGFCVAQGIFIAARESRMDSVNEIKVFLGRLGEVLSAVRNHGDFPLH